jgi:hypothetical protein
MEKPPKGAAPNDHDQRSKTEQRSRGFKKKHPPRTPATPTIDALKERVNQHIPVLRPGSVADLLTFKARLSDHLRATFTFNGNCLLTHRYYTGSETIKFMKSARTSVVRLKGSAEGDDLSDRQDSQDGEESVSESDTTQAETESNVHPVSREFEAILGTLPEDTRLKVLDAQITQAARTLMQNRQEADHEKMKIFALITSKLSEASMALLRNSSEAVELLRNGDDPIRLWTALELTHMGGSANRDTQEYQMVRSYQIIRMEAHESIHAFYERFTEVIHTLETYGCPLDPEHIQARHFLQQLDKVRYGRFLTDLQNLVSSGAIPAYPRTLAAAYTLAKERVEQSGTFNSSRFVSPVVYNTVGNVPSKDKKGKKQGKKSGKPNIPSSPPGTCDLCGNSGHFIRTCPKLAAAKEAVGREPSRFTATTFGFEGSQAVFMTTGCSNLGLKDTDILLDTQANVSVFRNADFLRDMRETENPISISGFVKGQSQRASVIGSFFGVEPVYYTPHGAANILSFNQIEKGNHQIDWVRDSHFQIVLEGTNIPICFRVHRTGLYVADGAQLLQQAVAMIATVTEREQMFPPDQVRRAREARSLQGRLGHPSAEALIRTLNQGALINSPVTAADVLRAQQIYGPSEAILQGSARKAKQTPMTVTEYAPKPLNPEQILIADIMYVEGEAYLISVSYPLRLVMIASLKDKKAASVANVLADHVDSYAAKGFTVTRVITDPEATLRAAATILMRRGIDHDETGVEQHAARVESMVKLVKERTRSILHSLPYKLPAHLMRYAVQYAVRMVNTTTPKNALQATSPRELFLGRKTDLKRDFRVAFGEYCHVPAYGGQSNTMKTRTLPAISLGGKGNVSGSSEFFILTTGRVVSRDHWTVIPMPQDAIEFLNGLSKQDKQDTKASMTTQNQVIEDLPFLPPAFKLIEPRVDQDNEEPMLDQDSGLDPEPPLEEPQADNSNEDEPVATEADGMEPRPDPEPPPIQIADDSEKGDTADPPEDVAASSMDAGQQRRRPTHLRPVAAKNKMVYNESYVFNISVAQGLQRHGKHAVTSIETELSQMINKGVWEPVRYQQVPRGSSIIPSFIFLKEKYDASGNFIKIKSRLVAGGHMQGDIDRQTSSPTVSLTAILMIAAIAAEERRHVVTLDIGGAYLNAPMKDENTFMILDKKVTEVLGNLDPSYKAFTTRKGTTIVRLKKALYGCRESGLLWYQTLSSFLSANGYTSNPYDRCVMNKSDGPHQTTVAIYVDDLFISGTNADAVNELIDALKIRFKELSVTQAGNILTLECTSCLITNEDASMWICTAMSQTS